MLDFFFFHELCACGTGGADATKAAPAPPRELKVPQSSRIVKMCENRRFPSFFLALLTSQHKNSYQLFLIAHPSVPPKNTAERYSAVFFYPSRRLGISSRRSRGYHQSLWGCISSRLACMDLRLDDIQYFVSVICNSFGIDDIQGFRLDLFDKEEFEPEEWFDVVFV